MFNYLALVHETNGLRICYFTLKFHGHVTVTSSGRWRCTCAKHKVRNNIDCISEQDANCVVQMIAVSVVLLQVDSAQLEHTRNGGNFDSCSSNTLQTDSWHYDNRSYWTGRANRRENSFKSLNNNTYTYSSCGRKLFVFVQLFNVFLLVTRVATPHHLIV